MPKLIPRTPAAASAWSVVAGDGSSYYSFPAAVLSPDGETIVCAYKHGDHNTYPPQDIVIRQRALSPLNAAWSPEVTIFSHDSGTSRSPADPVLLYTSTGRLLCFTTYVNHGGSYYRRGHLSYSDDGSTWTNVGAITNKFSAWNSPASAIEVDGTIYLVVYGQNSGDVGGYRIGLLSSVDGGITWSASIEVASGIAPAYSYEEPGIVRLDDGAFGMFVRTDEHAQIMFISADTITGTWRKPITIARGYGRCYSAQFSGNKFLLCQRWPANELGGQAIVFYTVVVDPATRLPSVSRPAFLHPTCTPTGTRRQMYGAFAVKDANTAVAIVGSDDGDYVGESTIEQIEVSIA